MLLAVSDCWRLGTHTDYRDIDHSYNWRIHDEECANITLPFHR